MASEIFVHECHIKRAETCLVASQNIPNTVKFSPQWNYLEKPFRRDFFLSVNTKKLSPLSWHCEQAYSKSRPPYANWPPDYLLRSRFLHSLTHGIACPVCQRVSKLNTPTYDTNLLSNIQRFILVNIQK